jgi:mannose-1-phosphate guanylyltransferase
VGGRSVLTGAVIGDGAVVGADNEFRDGARVWCHARIPAGAVRFSSDE